MQVTIWHCTRITFYAHILTRILHFQNMPDECCIHTRCEQIQIADENFYRRFRRYQGYVQITRIWFVWLYRNGFFFISFFAAKDENVRKIMREIENLTEDCTKLQQMLDITLSLRLVSWSFQTFSLSIYSIQFDLLFIFLISCEKYGASHQMPTSKYRGKCSRATKRFATTISWSTIKWLTAVCFGIGRKSIVSGIFVNYRWNFAICSFCVFFFFYFML